MHAIGQLLVPTTPRRSPHERAWNVGLRTAHMAVSSLLVSSHFFDSPKEDLRWVPYLSIVTGAGLIAPGIYPSCRQFFEGRGLMVLVKLAVLAPLALFWEYHVALFLLVTVIELLRRTTAFRFTSNGTSFCSCS